MGKKREYSNSGHSLTFREARFIEYLAAGKSEKEAYLMAGFGGTEKNLHILLGKKYIQEELKFQMNKIREQGIADGIEILTYYTEVMRGNIKDQFGLDAPLVERTRAANELAKRIIDYPREKEDTGPQEININLNWERKENEDA